MVRRNIFFIVLAFIIINVCFLIYEKNQIDSSINKNNELINGNIQKVVNEQLKLKNSPIISFDGYPNKSNRKITLDKEQINLINKNIAINSAKVDEAIETSKDEIGRDISRVSLYVAIFLAAVGILGIFIPIFLNFYSTRDLENRITTTERQLNDATDLLRLTTTLIDNTNETAEQASVLSQNALKSTNLANKKIEELSTLMYILDVLSKLKMLDFLRITNSQTREDYMRSYFKKLSNSFSSCKEQNISPSTYSLLKEACIDFSITLFQLTIYITADRKLLDNINSLIEHINELIHAEGESLNEAYDNLISLLKEVGENNNVQVV